MIQKENGQINTDTTGILKKKNKRLQKHLTIV